MTSTQFKLKLKEIKSFLIGKEIKITLVTNKGIEIFTYKTLKAFGSKVLELEKLEACFSFVTLSNRFIEKRVITGSELTNMINNGVWTKIKINASTI